MHRCSNTGTPGVDLALGEQHCHREQRTIRHRRDPQPGICNVIATPTARHLQGHCETAAEHQEGGNLLLACESGAGDLSDTRLSWVVGAAIRCTQIPSTAEAATLLEQMGCEPIQVAMLAEQCPGLGSDQTWAIYLDRHGWLTASPVPKEQDTISALEQA